MVDWSASIGDVLISDHRPILIQWNFEIKKEGFPFKFNRMWLKEHDFNNLVEEYMSKNKRKAGIGFSVFLMATLRGLKKAVKKWERSKKILLKA